MSGAERGAGVASGRAGRASMLRGGGGGAGTANQEGRRDRWRWASWWLAVGKGELY